jgi:hypothetical protein
MPLHTLIELTPMPDGTMQEERFKVMDCGAGPGSGSGSGSGGGGEGQASP